MVYEIDSPRKRYPDIIISVEYPCIALFKDRAKVLYA